MNPIQHTESDRLSALRDYRLLDSGAEKLYDNLTILASQICNTPISLISLVDEHRQWFKSKVGISVAETSREISICAHAIQKPAETFLVEDLTKDARFSSNPLVTGDPHAAFYAGVPLVDSAGFALGTLCVVDVKPRNLSSEQHTALRTLAKTVVTLMEESKRNSLFNYFYDNLHAIVNFSCPYFLFVDKNGKIRRFGSNFKYCLVDIHEGLSFEEVFDWEGVFNVQDAFSEGSGRSSNLVFFRIKNSQLRFKGAYLTFDDFILVLSSPVINSQTGTNDFGITLKDIPKHDYLTEYLFLQQTTTRSLMDAQVLTERIRHRNRELQEAQNEIKSISLFPSENPNPILRFSYDFKLLYKNESANTFIDDFGLSDQEIKDRELYHLVKESIEKGEEHKNIFVEKNQRFYSIWFRNVMDRGYFNIYANDITIYVQELNRKEKELEVKNAELQVIRNDLEVSLTKETEINRMKSRFISMTSHEFRTPLTTIQANAELLDIFLEGQPVTNKKLSEKYLNRITTEVIRLTNLMNDILLMGRIESGKIPYKPVETDIVAAVNELTETQRFEDVTGRKLQLKVLGEPRNAVVDPFLVNHILVNIVSNAFKYSKGKQAPELHINFREDRFDISVIDYGIGIPVADQSRIFDSFFRSSNVENIQGTGMGLAIVKQFLDLHQADIQIESREHEGTTIIMTFKYSNHSV